MVLYTILGGIVGGVVCNRIYRLYDWWTGATKGVCYTMHPQTANTIAGVLLGMIIGFCLGGFRLFHGHYLPWH